MLKRPKTIESKTAKPLSLWASRSAKIGPNSALEEIQINIVKGPGDKVVWQLRPILPSISYIWLCCSHPIVPKWLQFFNFIEFQFAWNKNLCIFQEIQTSIKNISKSWYFPLAYIYVYMLQWVCILFYYFCLFIPFIHFSHFHCQSRPLETTNMFSASMSLVFVLFRFHISIGLHRICFSVRLISLTIMPSRLSMLSKGKDFLLCYGWILFVCVCVCIYQNSFIHSSINDTEIVSITWLL